MSVVESVRRGVTRLTWVQRSLVVGALLTVAWMSWDVSGLNERLVRDTVVYILAPAALALSHGRDLGYRIDRTAVRNTILLSLFVLPFYVVGSSLPTIRHYYPMWETGAALGEFLPHALKQFVVALAAETYYRGLLCVGVREIGFKSVFISPFLYAFHHMYKPPVELMLSAPTDVLFGAVDYKSRSLLPSVVAHGIGLAVLDWLVLHEPLFPPEQVVRWLSWLPIPL
ncbi:CPBP family intramembrane metalloprotease [Halorussus vallis]|nr:CPBP family intramembrane glutamic endopeptidase [Halorussus vallis]USZ75419.1 CPBP family intramembrane metalloprotease [Halorussus vallis]